MDQGLGIPTWWQLDRNYQKDHPVQLTKKETDINIDIKEKKMT